MLAFNRVADLKYASNQGALLNNLAVTATFNSDAMDVQAYYEAIVFIKVYSQSGTTPTLDCKIQYSHNYDPQANTGDWVDSGDTFTQITTPSANTVSLKKLSSNFGKYIRFVVTLGGSTPNYTIDLALIGKL